MKTQRTEFKPVNVKDGEFMQADFISGEIQLGQILSYTLIFMVGVFIDNINRKRRFSERCLVAV